MSDRGCFWHGDEPIRPEHTTLCYECGHAFTTDELIAEDLRVRQELAAAAYPQHRPLVEPLVALTVEEIFVCPLCAHDL